LTGEEMQEMRRLSQILPSGMRTANPQNDPLQLIQNAAQYINQLTATLVARVQNGSIPQGLFVFFWEGNFVRPFYSFICDRGISFSKF
jgi:hypothetical protein